MIDERMLALGQQSSVIREIFEYGNKRRREIGAENVYDFSLGNPSVPTPQAVTDAMRELLATDPVALHGYTSAPGDPGVRAAMAAHIEKTYGVKAEAQDIYMTCGAAASLTVSLSALVRAGEEVVVLAPFFPEYDVFVRTAGGTPVVLKTEAPAFLPDAEKLAAVIGEKTAAVIVNYPNNPTGAIWDEKTLRAVVKVLEEKQKELGREIFIISDEPYRELTYGKPVPFVPAYYDNTIVCYSFSKSLSLPGERIGYIFVPQSAARSRELFAAVCGAGRALGFVCAPSLMQRTAAACADLSPDLTVYRKNRDLLYGTLTGYGYECVPPDGAFYLFVKSPEPDAKRFSERAKKYELLLVPGDSFGAPGYVRISYCVSTAMIEKCLAAFEKLMGEYKNGGY